MNGHAIDAKRNQLFADMQVNVLTDDPLGDNEKARKEVARNFVCESDNL